MTILLASILVVMARKARVLTSSNPSMMYEWEKDSLFLRHSTPVQFVVNRHDLPTRVCDSIVGRFRKSVCQGANIRIRGAASPEGPYWNNIRLSNGRTALIRKFLLQAGVPDSSIHIDIIHEDYPLLLSMMQQRQDPAYDRVLELVKTKLTHPAQPEVLKKALQTENHGKLWRHLLDDYFPLLRATRIRVMCPEEEVKSTFVQKLPTDDYHMQLIPPVPTDTVSRLMVRFDSVPALPVQQLAVAERLRRKEMVSVKTNLLYDLAYVPRWGFCPFWNVALEYYPLDSHYTIGASFDCPWWLKRSKHKYFQARNYELFVRRYLGERGVYRGWYLEGYGNVIKYGIGFNADDGWQGEGFGGGLGCGYVCGLTRDKHLKLEFGLQMGYFWTKYDPYQYTCPIEGEDDGRYYYKWTLPSSLFHKRRYSKSWIGPTRIGVSLSWDFIYYSKRRVKG